MTIVLSRHPNPTNDDDDVSPLGLGDNLHSAVIALDAVWMLDLDGVQALQEIVEEFSRTGLRVYLAGVHLVNTTGAVRPSFGGDLSQHGLGLGNDASPDRARQSFRGVGPLTQGVGNGISDFTLSKGAIDDSSNCLPPILVSSLPSGGGAHTATVTVTKLLTQQAFYQVNARSQPEKNEQQENKHNLTHQQHTDLVKLIT